MNKEQQDRDIQEAFNDLALIFSDYDLHKNPLMKIQVMHVLEQLTANISDS